jgi:hypothetical protein
MSHAEELETKGYTQFAFDPRLAAWAAHAASISSTILSEPANEKWWRHQRTWFVGVDALHNDGEGRLPDGPPLAGEVIDFVGKQFGFAGPWHKGQISVCFPGYPQRDLQESEAQHKFRLTRDAAHVDGLYGEGPAKRRHFRETHQFILGIPLNAASAEDSPLVCWEGSHLIMQDMFAKAFAGIPEAQWSEVDVTEVYQTARQHCFETCRRVIVHAQPGKSYIIHKLALHGVAPWTGGNAPDASRMIAYFRPQALSPIAIGH